MYSLEQIERLLQTYSFEEILEMNDLTEADVLYLIQEQLEIPIRPVDL